jgi:hypothetical protein
MVASWHKWGPYLSERQWGTVREDYSDNGDAWSYFTHDQARSRAYRWGEDGLAGFSDNQQRLCFALSLWNTKDPILKERAFGLTNAEGNHGEDVKEYYFYLDSTPTHSYMRYLYKYPQAAFPYHQLVETNRNRSRLEPEFELLDTGVFDQDRYFDVFAEFAKVSAEDILIKFDVRNRSSEQATLHLLPTIWFRNTWTYPPNNPRPQLSKITSSNFQAIRAEHFELGTYWLYGDASASCLFTENETNNERLFHGKNESPFVKDGINEFVVNGQQEAVNPANHGTKAAFQYVLTVAPRDSTTVYLRLSNQSPDQIGNPLLHAMEQVQKRSVEADEFYSSLTPSLVSADAASVMRQAYSGMLWSKQYYFFDANLWLKEHGVDPFRRTGREVRNRDWSHMINSQVIAMPDKWEYPWYAAWDLAFHAVTLASVDVNFAKNQLDMMLRELYIHPSGQLPAYEWNFSDVNPPVHAWSTIFIYRMEEAFRGEGDLDFLKRSFSKLLANFTWWVNRKDRFGRNVFEGGFLGLDNIGVFDRSAPLPTGGYLEQADGTAWMSIFCQNMLEIAVEIAAAEPVYEDLAAKFVDHFLWIANALNEVGDGGMWDEEDGFYYDVLRLPDGSSTRLKVRSMVGLLPLCATTIVDPEKRQRVPKLLEHTFQRLKHFPELGKTIHPVGDSARGVQDRGIMAVVNPERLRRILIHMLDEEQFLGPHGIRALSRYHLEHPYVFPVHGAEYKVSYLPAESDSGMFGGNSNWRGPVWMPVNVLLLRALLNFYLFYGDNFKIECPTGSGNLMNLYQVAEEIAKRLISTFVKDDNGHRPVFGGALKFQEDPNWKDCLLFYEYFHGDNGAGIGASHQTGWTGLVASLIRLFGKLKPEEFLRSGEKAVFGRSDHPLDV